LVLQAARPDKDLDINEISFGVTATKKLGNAVVRNRAKRRLRAVAEAVFPVSGKAGTEYVLIGRQGTLDRSFEKLLEDLELALQMISKPRPRDQRKRRRQ
jgi:ribonuclease P protein component